MTFGEYVAFYQLGRSEGLVLRYLSDAYRAARQTIPDDAKTEELRDLIEWLGELVRQVDSSLLDEWEALTNPVLDPEAPIVPPAPTSVVTNRRAFMVLVRNELWRRVRLAALQRDDELVALDPEAGWSEALDAYFDEHDEIGTGTRRAKQRPHPDRRGARRLEGASDHRRPGRAPRLGHPRRGRSVGVSGRRNRCAYACWGWTGCSVRIGSRRLPLAAPGPVARKRCVRAGPARHPAGRHPGRPDRAARCAAKKALSSNGRSSRRSQLLLLVRDAGDAHRLDVGVVVRVVDGADEPVDRRASR